MATKLKNLKITKVDFVDEGANPDAHIRLFKGRAEPAAQESGKDEKASGILKRLAAFLKKEAGMVQDADSGTEKEIKKGDPASFNEKFNEVKNRKISDEIWDMCYALQSSLCSILNDGEMDSNGALSAMQDSLDEFHAIAQESAKNWADGKESGIVRKDAKMTETELKVMKAARDRLEESLKKASARQDGPKAINEDQKGEKEMGMKIDKGKLTPAELAFYESIVKRCGTEELEKAAEVPAGAEPGMPSAPDDIYKGLHPAVKAELEELKKFREAAEEKELNGIAKKYAVIGKKAEELAPMLKGLKAAGGTAYDDMIAVLDQAVDTVEKSGLFSEIGKSGHGGYSEHSAEAKISSIAKGYMEKDSGLSYNAAVAKAWEDNPDIMDEYEEEAGF